MVESSMSIAQLRAMLDDRAQVVPLSVDQYHRMIQTGILPEGEPIELLDGFLVRKDRSKHGGDPMTVGHERAWVIQSLNRLLPSLVLAGYDLRVQLPVTLPPDNEPEPDGAIVRGTFNDYRTRHPGPSDIACIIEVADSSLQHDRTTKLRIYADAGIPQYLIINLVDRQVESHLLPQISSGSYGDVRTLPKGEQVTIVLANDQSIAIPVADLLP
jgi:Uma2 family endonuclease